MKLDRNISADGRGKYALLKMRRLAQLDRLYDGGDGDVADLQAIKDAVALLERAGVIDYGDTTDSEFFVMRLKDWFASNALFAYAISADAYGDHEYGQEMVQLSKRSANHPNRKIPD